VAADAAEDWLNRNNRIHQNNVKSECGLDLAEGYDEEEGGFAFADVDSDGKYDKIRACVRRDGFLLFSRLLGLTDIKVTAVAAAGLHYEPSRYALMAMNPANNCDNNDGLRSLQTRGNAEVILGDDGSSYTATPCVHGGLAAEGNSLLDGGTHDICGQTADADDASLEPDDPRPGICGILDPWLSYDQPIPGTCLPGAKKDFMFNDGGTHTLNPGTFCHTLDIQTGSTVVLSPGVYVFRDGVEVSSGATITGEDVVLYFTCSSGVSCNGGEPDPFNVSGGNVALSALKCDFDETSPDAGDYPTCPEPEQEPRIVIWVDRTAVQTGSGFSAALVSLNGNGAVTLGGNVYNWGGTVFLSGTGNADNWTVDGTILGHRIEFGGNATYNINWDEEFAPKITEIALVE
jgi:hypothetical protein